jgi:flagellar basal-body rod protein FlgG
MLGQLEQQDAISNNLANANTTGFKRTRVGFSSFSTELAAASRSISTTPSKVAGCVISTPFTAQDMSQGMIQDTANPANFAIEGDGYFVISRGGNQQLTRSGDFRVNGAGQLVTSDGGLVMGQNGPINVSGANWSVNLDGSIRVDGNVVDRLKISTGNTTRTANSTATKVQVTQGKLEGSNVSVVREMVSMITAMRSYEAGQKSIQALDQTLEKVINMPRNA